MLQKQRKNKGSYRICNLKTFVINNNKHLLWKSYLKTILFLYSQSCLQQTFRNTYTCWICIYIMVLYSSQSLSHVQLPFKIPGFYFSHETTTLITKSRQCMASGGLETQISEIQIYDKCCLNSPPLPDQWFAIPQSPHRSCDLPKRDAFPLGAH